MITANKEPVMVFGASGHAKVVIDVIEKQGQYSIAFLIDDDSRKWGQEFYGYPVRGGKEALLADDPSFPRKVIVAIGDNSSRMKMAKWLSQNGFELVSVLHPSAQIARGVRIARGVAVMAGCVINSDANIGENAIINTGATVDHDCIIGGGSHVAPGCHICGGVRVGEGSLVGAASAIMPGIVVGSGVIVGAGSTVIRNVGDNEKVAGSPARALDVEAV